MKKGLFTTFVLAIMSVFLMPFATNALEDTLQSKIDVAKDGDVITLDKDYKEDITIPEGKKIVLDLNGKNLTNVSKDTITNSGTLTIKGNGNVTNTVHGKTVIANNYGTVVIDGGTFSRVDNGQINSYYVIINHGDMTINKGAVSVSGGVSSLIENGWISSKNNTKGSLSTLTINGGTFTMTGNDKYIKNDECGVITVNGGTYNFDATTSAVVANLGSETGKETATITGGVFNFASDNYAIWDYSWGAADKSVTNVNGGVFNITDSKGKVTNVAFNESAGIKEFEVIGDPDKKVVVNVNDLKEVADVKKMDESAISAEDLVLIKKAAGSKKIIIGYFDIDLFNQTSDAVKVEQLTETTDKVKVTLNIPEGVKEVASGYERQYYVVRLHAGKTDLIKCTLNEDGTVSFETDKFSTYTLTYTDVKATNLREEDTIANPNTFDGIVTYIVIGLVGVLGLAGVGFYLKKQFN